MEFTDTEIESVREIVGVSTDATVIDDLTTRLNGLNAAQAAATRTDITKWSRIADGTIRVRPSGKGTDYDIERDRAFIANRVRLRLRYPQLTASSLSDPTALNFIRVRIPTSIYGDDATSSE